MGASLLNLIKPRSGGMCKTETIIVPDRRNNVFCLGLLLVWMMTIAMAGAARAEVDFSQYETWSSESYTLDPRESFQLHVTFDDIKVRNWKLIVDGGDQNCDLNVVRTRDKSIIYQLNDQRHHEVEIPWGIGESLTLAITNRTMRGAFVVTLLGPPEGKVHAAYSFHVNRALDKFAVGQRLAAEDECRKAILMDPSDGVAKVLLAGILRDRHYFDRALGFVEEALAADNEEKQLDENMREIAEKMRRELIVLRAPLPLPVSNGVSEAEQFLIAGKANEAMDVCDRLLASDLEMDNNALSRLAVLRGQALDQLDRDYDSLQEFTKALELNRLKDSEAVIYFHMARLFLKMKNYPQAEGAFTVALKRGLPSGLDVQAREGLRQVEAGLKK
ncbi:MAG: tetratricopeptide (TPR) repeat protein [Candidatus Krumholzibacteriia bacterium]|jgi:tetratricopeptide (TPR) repeat protein